MVGCRLATKIYGSPVHSKSVPQRPALGGAQSDCCDSEGDGREGGLHLIELEGKKMLVWQAMPGNAQAAADARKTEGCGVLSNGEPREIDGRG